MDYSSLLNDPVRSPKGSYTPLEELLLKLKVVSEINGRDRLYHNGRTLKKFDDDKDNENNNFNESMTFSEKELDGIEVKTENMTENIMENENGSKCETENVNKTENENENEKRNEYHGKSVNGGFKRTRSEDTYSSTTTAPILMPSSPSSSTSTSTATSTSLKDYKRLNISKAFEILKNKLSMGNNQISFHSIICVFLFFFFSVLFWYVKGYE